MANELLIAALEIVTAEGVDLEAVEAALASTPGDFRTRWAAAVTAAVAGQSTPEVWIDVPENPGSLTKGDLDALVRPSPFVYLRSNPTKAELQDALATIARTQAERPDWIPRQRPDGTALPTPIADDNTPDVVDGVAEIGSLTEIGPITVRHYAGDPEAPRLTPAMGGIGQWEAAIFQMLGFTRGGPVSSIVLDAEANEALITDEAPWWRPEPAQRKTAAKDPGVERLATDPGIAESVLDLTTAVLAKAGWTELHGSVWEGGLEERFYRRGASLLEVGYDPTTRQVHLRDGGPGVALGLDLLSDEDAVVWEGDKPTIDVEKATAAGWKPVELDAILAQERGETEPIALPSETPQVSVIGLHPYSDGTLRAPESTELVAHQLTAFLTAMEILQNPGGGES